MNDPELAKELGDYLYGRRLTDGRILGVVALTFGRARIVLGDEYFVDNGW